MDPISALVIARGLERLLIVAAGAAAMWMGWRLFLSLGEQASQEAEFSYKDLLIKFQRVGPGAFFALFGAAIIIVSISNPLRIVPGDISIENEASTSGNPGSVSYLGGADKQTLERWIVGLNTVLAISGLPADLEIPEPDRDLLIETNDPTEEVRNELLKFVFNESDVAIWLKWRGDFANNPSSVPESERPAVEMVQELASHTFFDGEIN